MRNFDIYFSQRLSFLFPNTRITWRGLCESYPLNWSQDFLHRFSPGLFSSLRNQCFRVLRDATQLWYNFHKSHRILVDAFSVFVGMVAFLWLFVWLFINLMMRDQTLISGFATRFCLGKLTLGRVPIFTRLSRAGTSQIISARLSENGTMVDLARRMAQKVWRHCGLVFVHDHYSHAGTCISLLANTGRFLSTGNRYLFLLQRHSIPCDY